MAEQTGRRFQLQLTPQLFTSCQEAQKAAASNSEHFFSTSTPFESSPDWDIYIGIFSTTPTFITAYTRYRRAFVANKVHVERGEEPVTTAVNNVAKRG